MLQNLPELFLDLVCEHLSYEDVLALRSTCKGLKQFFDSKHFKKLNLFIRKYSYHHRLFYTDKWICYQHSLHSDDLTILTANRFRERFRNVQQMIICNRPSDDHYKDADTSVFDLTCLNYFAALSHLEIDEMPCIEGKLDLPQLRIAAFKANPKNEVPNLPLVLNCPRLRALKVTECQPDLTDETDQLEYLQYDISHNENHYLKCIRSNLQKLSTIYLQIGSDPLKFISDFQTGSLILPSLSEIRIEHCPPLGELYELVNSLQKLKSDPRTKHIKFVLVGRLFDSPDELSQIFDLILARPVDFLGRMVDWTVRTFEDDDFLLLNENPELGFLLSPVRHVVLEDLELTEEIFRKLENVRWFELRERCKPGISTFELLARNCKLIDTLSLNNQTVTGRLLEILSKDLLNLMTLFIDECEYETLKPLAKFRNLEKVCLDFTPPRDELIFIYENSRTLEVVCNFGPHKFGLLRTTTWPRMRRITLKHTDGNHERYYFRTLHSMINYCYENRFFENRESEGASTRLTEIQGLELQ